jgi:acyl carrier protein
MNDIREQIRNLMAIVFEIDINKIKDNAEPSVIETWDSLKHMSLIVALEEEFDIIFTDEEMMELLNLELITRIVSEKLNFIK